MSHKVLHKHANFTLPGFSDQSVHRNMSFVRFWLENKLAELADEHASMVRGNWARYFGVFLSPIPYRYRNTRDSLLAFRLKISLAKTNT
jgi:hypothetical protein